ncbi:MAG: hypothetical protein NC079_01185 [Clostridium sp.]|nr:hypothetical protein [Acetatifactor muris]MCM1562202.1 hypothetical protein [Clostridium sp.]
MSTMILTVCATGALSVLFGWGVQKIEKKETGIFRSCVPHLAAWIGTWVLACVLYGGPGIAAGFGLFRALTLCAVVVWLNLCLLLIRLRQSVFLLILFVAMGCEVFVFNSSFFTTHEYEPQRLSPYLSEEAVSGEWGILMDEEHNTLLFEGLDIPVWNLWLEELTYGYLMPYQAEANPYLAITVAGSDEANSLPFNLGEWEVALQSERSHYRNVHLSGNADSLILVGNVPAVAIYAPQYPFSYTIKEVWANVPKPFAFSLVRFVILTVLLLAAYGLRPGSILWQQDYLTHRQQYGPLLAACVGVAVVTAAVTPFLSETAAGIATITHNVLQWEGDKTYNFTYTMEGEEGVRTFNFQYGALAHALLNGKLYLDKVEPSEGLLGMENPYDAYLREQVAPDAVWDVAFYDGKYYSYFGIIPCLLFQLPYEAITGTENLPPSIPMILMAAVYILSVFGLWEEMLKRWFPKASVAAYFLICMAMIGGSQLYVLLVRPWVYEYAILCGIAFILLGLWQWMAAVNTAEEKQGKRIAHLIVGSLCVALAAGCRPQVELFAFLCLPIFAGLYLRRKRLLTGRGIGEAVAFITPVLLVAAGLMWYNYARFGSVLDFGATYNLTTNDMTRRGFDVGRIGPALFYYICKPLSLKAAFPYICTGAVEINYLGLTTWEYFNGGILATAPFVAVLFLIPVLRRGTGTKKGAWGIIGMGIIGSLLMIILDAEMAGILYRYMMDFSPVLLMCAGMAWLFLEDRLREKEEMGQYGEIRRVFRIVLPVLVLAGIVISFLQVFTVEPWLNTSNPALYQDVSRMIQFWM